MKTIAMTVLAAAMAASAQGAAAFRAADYGIVPGNAFSAGQVARLVEDLRRTEGDKTLLLEPGRYDVGAAQCQTRTWFISNHDQTNPRRVFLPLEGIRDLTVRAEGAFINLRGRIIALGVWDSANVTVQGLTIDCETQPMTQINLTAVDAAAQTVTFTLLPEANSAPAAASSSRPTAASPTARRTWASASPASRGTPMAPSRRPAAPIAPSARANAWPCAPANAPRRESSSRIRAT